MVKLCPDGEWYGIQKKKYGSLKQVTYVDNP